MEKSIKLFNDAQNSNKEKWYFSVVAVLTDNDIKGARSYWKVLKHRLKKEGNEMVTNCNQFKIGGIL